MFTGGATVPGESSAYSGTIHHMAKTPLKAEIHEVLTIREQLGIRAKRATEKKWFVERWIKASFYKTTGTWHKVERLINRDTDQYQEVVTDADGNVLHRCEEPLSAHRGHGDAKRT
jgi:hypothetical protein